jgi:sterol desaturase/sphingolipid hydroxylase (fatty acid hydroxylase superfamily)
MDTIIFFLPLILFFITHNYINIYASFVFSGASTQLLIRVLETKYPHYVLPPIKSSDLIDNVLDVTFGLVSGLFVVNTISIINPGINTFWSWNTLASLVTLDFVYYILHRWGYHRGYIPFLLLIHKTHHKIRYMDSVRGTKASFLDQLIVQVAAGTIFSIYSLDSDASNQLYLVFLLYQTCHHVNIELNIGVLRYIFSGSTEHLDHHKHPGTNFGVIFSVWDIMFGTFHH